MTVYAIWDGFDDFVYLFETADEAENYISKQDRPEDYTCAAVKVMKTAEEAIQVDEEY